MPGAARVRLVEQAADGLRGTLMAMRLRGPGIPDEPGLTPLAWVVLRIVRGAGQMQPSELALRLGTARATVTGLLNRLERNGLVERVRDAGNRRIVLVQATPKAVAGMRRFRATWLRQAAQAFAPLDDAQLGSLAQLLARTSLPPPKAERPGRRAQ